VGHAGKDVVEMMKVLKSSSCFWVEKAKGEAER
jgi:hypothetical protein